MNCEQCEKDTKNFNVLPLKQEDGRLNLIVCDDCAKESGFYCSKHEVPHLGFEDGSSACHHCIEEKVAENGREVVRNFREKIFAAKVGPNKLAPLGRWIQEGSEMTGFDPDVVLARGIIKVAERLEKSTDEIAEMFIKDGPKVIVPWLTESNGDDFS